ncbi:Biotin synthesis protein bioK (chromatophore) [Paulinella micropora]|uniref:Alpha/beta hydrolase n=1 Tax=Paulinella micropora TaxID=1928728 RepID=A0A1L5YB99_9EUKA|nr:alpha/beta hydrolase [Paulinella micropora]AQX44742.1 alpha/beta hydrolase [Paulinella micropora]BBL85954.1 Biotin synthesis protein bioK [Paulinella micropora]
MNQTGEIIAMHGWSGDSNGWNYWAEFARYKGWSWQSGERGYGSLPVVTPQWKHKHMRTQGPRVLMVHSFGLYLLPTTVLASAEIIVLLNSFNRFIPSCNYQHLLERKIKRMINDINFCREKDTLITFLIQANLPSSTDMTSLTFIENSISRLGRMRLLEDLHKLAKVTHLPAGFPADASLLIVNTQSDRIVAAPVKKNLVENLANHMSDKLSITHWSLENIGHNLHQTNLLQCIFNWLEIKL